MTTERDGKEGKAMPTANDVRRAHYLLDHLGSRTPLSNEHKELLRSFLPELPKQKTLEEICVEVEGLCDLASSSEGFLPIGGMGVRPRLEELHAQLKGLKDAPATVPALPAGMRLADHEEYGRVVVSPNTLYGQYKIFHLDRKQASESDHIFVSPDTLTFIDTEPAEPTHAKFLETEEDYVNAPEGTVVAAVKASSAMKCGRWWESSPYMDRDAKTMAGEPRRVLRWGWGNE